MNNEQIQTIMKIAKDNKFCFTLTETKKLYSEVSTLYTDIVYNGSMSYTLTFSYNSNNYEITKYEPEEIIIELKKIMEINYE